MIKVYWRDEEKRILVREMDCTWTWDDYYAKIEEMKQMLETVEHPVIVLVDCRNVKYASSVPADALQHFSKANRGMPDTVLGQIIVSENKWLETISAILHHVLPEESRKLFFVRSIEKAEQRIEKLSKEMRRARRGKRGMDMKLL